MPRSAAAPFCWAACRSPSPSSCSGTSSRATAPTWKPRGATGTTKQQTRNGAEVSIGGGLERHFFERFGIFGEADYVYGFTSLGRSAATPGSICASGNGCDVLKNTSVGTIRGGLSVKLR